MFTLQDEIQTETSSAGEQLVRDKSLNDEMLLYRPNHF